MRPYDNRPERERRSQARRRERVPVRFYDPAESGCHTGILINGSERGAFIETNESLPLLTTIRIEGPGIVYHAQVCRVHWLRPEERAQHVGGMAVRLLQGRQEITDADFEGDDGPVLSLSAAQGSG